MYDVMAGFRVVDVTEMLLGPCAAMTLADWGAHVIKVERTGGGDRTRHMPILQSKKGWNTHFEVGNRGKKSIALDLDSSQGRKVLRKLIESADVFLTNYRPKAQQKLGIRAEDVTKINPRIVYAWASGYGPVGPRAETPGFDWPSAWCHTGSAFTQTLPGGEPPFQPASVGDLMGGFSTAAAISAALLRRERTGKGCVVNNSLFQTGIYIMTQSITLAAVEGPGTPERPLYGRRDIPIMALNYTYRTKDERWIALSVLMEAWWPDFTRHIGREDWLNDPRFASVQARNENMRALIGEIEKIFVTKTFAEWKKILSTLEGVWAPLASADEVLEDEQALANGYVTPVTRRDGTTYLSCATPGQFDERPVGHLSAAPDYGEHTDELLREVGYDASEIAALRQTGHVA